MQCYLCGKQQFTKRPGRVRDRADLDVLECQACGLVCLSSATHITEGFYEGSGMHAEPLAITDWVRETAADDRRRLETLRPMLVNKSLLDFGCGNGGFLESARQVAQTAVGVEPEARLQPYFQSRQLKVYASLAEVDQTFEVITLFHVLEHLADPSAILRQLTQKLTAQGRLIIEVPNADDALLTLYQSAAFADFTYWSCHLFLYNAATLTALAKKAGLKVNFIRHIQRYPLSNHLHWLAQNRPGGHIHWSFLDSPELAAAYESRLAALGCSDTILAGFGVKDA